MNDWGAPDVQGISTRVEYLNPRRQMSGKRFRRSTLSPDLERVTWSREALTLLADILPPTVRSRRWTVLRKLAGPERLELLRLTIENLVRCGVVVVEERKPRARDWGIEIVEFIELGELRRLAGLPDLVQRAVDAKAVRAYAAATPPAARLTQSLVAMKEPLAIRRGALVRALDEWIGRGRTGTRRDFALAATGDTKGIADSDWDWLTQQDVLDEAGVVEHDPLLMVAGSWTLHLPGDRRLDVGAVAEGLGVTPGFISGAERVSRVRRWYLFENRTVFDRAARVDARVGIIWLPGYAPGWWMDVVDALLRLGPAPATFACDPDPAGIAIVLRAAELWERHGLGWTVAGMAARDLLSLPVTRALTQADETLLRSLPADVKNADLEDLKQTMAAKHCKGEQEGFYTMDRLRILLTGNPE